MDEWNAKMERIVEEVRRENVGSLSGVFVDAGNDKKAPRGRGERDTPVRVW